MNASVTLDFLISNSNGNTLYFSIDPFPKEIVKEAILRGFQVMSLEEWPWEFGILIYSRDNERKSGRGYSCGAGWESLPERSWGYGSGHGNGYGSGYGSMWNNGYLKFSYYSQYYLE